MPYHLGQTSPYKDQYDPNLLEAITRQRTGPELSQKPLPFVGLDLWRAYEVSWLDKRGKPEVAIAQLQVPVESPALVESKSLKLYLNSFNQTPFVGRAEVEARIAEDLSALLGCSVPVSLSPLGQPDGQARLWQPEAGQPSNQACCLDNLAVRVEQYSPNAELLSHAGPDWVDEQFYTHLFRSCCPVTGQPDWASLWIHYQGSRIDPTGLLRYLLSYRTHADFHEHCIETIFMHLWQVLKPQTLLVYGAFLRRGGLDINPIRYSRNYTEQVAGQALITQLLNHRWVRQ